MSTQSSVYSAFSALLAEATLPVSPAELHGHLLGRVCACAGFNEADWLQAAGELLGKAPSKRLVAALSGLFGMVQQDFSTDEITLVLLLPNDETPLTQRVMALCHWCQGFLAGFGLTVREGGLTGEAAEVLQDMAAIAQLQSQQEYSEDDETNYMEVMEYLRVAPLLLSAECTKPEKSTPKSSLH